MQQPWLPEKWDKEADVVVVGFGGAGAAAAITAQDLGARVLMLEKAPEGEEGGNTRIAGQGYLQVYDVDKAITYLNALCGRYVVPQRMVRAWAEEVRRNNDWVASIGGDPQEHQHQPEGIEFPELPGADCTHKFHNGDILGYSNTWKFFESAVKRRPIEILYESPGRELIQDGITNQSHHLRVREMIGVDDQTVSQHIGNLLVEVPLLKHSPRGIGSRCLRLKIFRKPPSNLESPRACLRRDGHCQAFRLRLVNPKELAVVPRAAVDISQVPAQASWHSHPPLDRSIQMACRRLVRCALKVPGLIANRRITAGGVVIGCVERCRSATGQLDDH